MLPNENINALIDTIESFPTPLKSPMQQLLGHINGLKLLHNACLEKELNHASSKTQAALTKHIQEKMREMRNLFNQTTNALVTNLHRCLHDQSINILDMNELGTRAEMHSCLVNARYIQASNATWPIPISPIYRAIGNYLIAVTQNIDTPDEAL